MHGGWSLQANRHLLLNQRGSHSHQFPKSCFPTVYSSRVCCAFSLRDELDRHLQHYQLSMFFSPLVLAQYPTSLSNVVVCLALTGLTRHPNLLSLCAVSVIVTLAASHRNSKDRVSNPLSEQLLIALLEFCYPTVAFSSASRCEFDIDHSTVQVRLMQFQCLLEGITVTELQKCAALGFIRCPLR